MSARANKRFNFDGNVKDELGGSYYVVDADGNEVLGPFATGSYAVTCRNRYEDQWPLPLEIEYRP